MKNLLLTTAIVAFSFSQLNAQTNGAAINSTGAAADPSAMLDISSSSKGLLTPRMSEAERLAISNPARGLLVYQIDNDYGFWFFDGNTWIEANSGDNLGNHTATDSVNMSNKKITNLATCTQNLDAANKEYVDNAVAAGGGSSGFTMLSDESATAMTFGDAIRYCKSLTATINGTAYSDWRLPSLYELISVVSAGNSYATNTSSSNYIWVSNYDDTYSLTSGYSRFIYFRLSDGFVNAATNTSTRYVRCVR